MKTTFLIPSIGRNTLSRTIESIQSNVEECDILVVFDNVSNPPKVPDFVRVVNLQEKLGVLDKRNEHGNAGFVRNHGLNLITTEWVSFVDDDDIVSKDYLDFIKTNSDCDFLIHRMISFDRNLPKGAFIIAPHLQNENLQYGNIGINVSVKMSFLNKNNIRFTNSDREDFLFIVSLLSYGASYKISKNIQYIANF